MVLEGQELADPPGLYRGPGGGGEQDGLLGQVDDDVVVGDDDRQARSAAGGHAGAHGRPHRLVNDLGEDRVGAGGLRQLQVDDAVLAAVRGGAGGGPAQGLGRDLGAQADGDGGQALLDGPAQQGAHVGQPRVAGVVVRAHGPAQDHQAVADAGGARDGLPRPGAHHAQRGALGEEPLPQAPQRREGLGLDHGNDRGGVGECREDVSHGAIDGHDGPGRKPRPWDVRALTARRAGRIARLSPRCPRSTSTR